MTPYETAQRLIRQRGTTVSDPDFIATYLAAEIASADDHSDCEWCIEADRWLGTVDSVWGAAPITVGQEAGA